MTTLDEKIAGLSAESRERVRQGSDALISAEARNLSGLRHLQEGAYRQAIENFSEALKLDPDNSTAYNNRGLAYMHEADYAHAIADFDAALALDPELFECLVNRGIVYSRMGEADRAMADYRKAMALKSDGAAAHNLEALGLDRKAFNAAQGCAITPTALPLGA